MALAVGQGHARTYGLPPEEAQRVGVQASQVALLGFGGFGQGGQGDEGGLHLPFDRLAQRIGALAHLGQGRFTLRFGQPFRDDRRENRHGQNRRDDEPEEP